MTDALAESVVEILKERKLTLFNAAEHGFRKLRVNIVPRRVSSATRYRRPDSLLIPVQVAVKGLVFARNRRG